MKTSRRSADVEDVENLMSDAQGEPPESKPPTQLFVSHAAHDKAVVEALVDLLEGGLGVPHQSIFCSSLKGQSIKPGSDFVDSIRTRLDEATCMVALISEAYYASAFCMCELGGTWLQVKSFIPVLLPPIGFSNLKAVLHGMQALKLDREEDLDELRDELVERLKIQDSAHGTPRWNRKRGLFLEQLPALIKANPFTGLVAREEFDKVVRARQEFESEAAAGNVRVGQLEKLVAMLQNTKDRAQVSEVLAANTPAVEEFERLVDDATSALHTVERPVREALFSHYRKESYRPKGSEAWDEVRDAEERGQLQIEGEDDEVVPNLQNVKVRRCSKALDALAKWLEKPPPPEFFTWYERENEGIEAEIVNRDFWEEHLF